MTDIPTTEKTFVLLKPDAVRRGISGEILERFEKRGLKIIAMKMVTVGKDQASKHYKEHKKKPFFDEIVGFITSGPIVAIVVEGKNSITAVRKIVGSTNPEQALPGTIRGDFAHTLAHGGKNLIHASANKEDAEIEIDLWFDIAEINTYSRNDEGDVL